jgi:ADP-ribose pyrophosphatase YjhB (NUDIX family)
VSAGQHWLVTWHPPGAAITGRPHGATGVCLGSNGRDLILISPDEVYWGLPGGRPEGTETLRQTLDREMREEACVEVLDARLLGFSRSVCTQGQEKDLVLVRSFWRAQVNIEPWQPEFEIPYRRVVPAARARDFLREPDTTATRISLRALAEAGLA